MSAGPRGRCACAVCTTEAALVLLRTGRPAMALAVLEPLPALIREAQGAAWAKGVGAGAEAARGVAQELAAGVAAPVAAAMKVTGPRPSRRSPAPPPAPAFHRIATELREHVGRLGADRVAELLGVRPDDLGPLLEGRAGIGRSALDRVRRARA